MGASKRRAKSCVDKPAGERATQFPRKAVLLYHQSDETEESRARTLTELIMSPEMAALRVMRGADQKSGNWDSVDVPSLISRLRDQVDAVRHGNLADAEAMLINQAVALQCLFTRLAERGMSCDHAPAFEANMRIALRAQSQCRAVLETLAAIKNPPVVFAKQANISSGHQQVNNGLPSPAHAGETGNPQSKLMEHQNGNWLDTGPACSSASTDQVMATVGKVDGSTNAKRQGGRRSKRV